MQKRMTMRIGLVTICAVFVGIGRCADGGEAVEPIIHTVRFPSPNEHTAEVEAVFPTDGRASIEIMMAVWSPGFYRVEDYAKRVEGLKARTTDGAPLEVEPTRKNRWRIKTGGEPNAVVSYRLSCKQTSVTTNYVGDDLAVLNGAAAFFTLNEPQRRPHEVRLELPAKWKRAATALAPAPDGRPNHFRAPDYDTLVDSPIVAGNPTVREFTVEGSKHVVADIGDIGSWDGEKAAKNFEKIVRETRRFWGFLPFDTYHFLLVFRRGGGGLEHKNSTLLTASSARMASGESSFRWLSFVSHEYFHAFNVKRLRPIELGPFDYENPPKTASLWISEGLTSYFGDLIVARAGLCTREEYLGAMSSDVEQLQNSPGRLVQSLEQSSLDVWGSGTSGVGRDRASTVNYYVKGPVVGFLLDAKIRRVTSGKKSFDDVMRLAYKRYAGERGFTPDQFRATAEEVASTDLKDWFHKAISSSEELDYSEALDWFGLGFAPPEEAPSEKEPATKAEPKKVEATPQEKAQSKQRAKKWKLMVRADANETQKAHLNDLLHLTQRR
jgi:predicted metalloprotease with PDZ domain